MTGSAGVERILYKIDIECVDPFIALDLPETARMCFMRGEFMRSLSTPPTLHGR